MADQPLSTMPLFRRAELAVAGAAVVLLIACSLTVILLRLFSATSWSVSLVDSLSQYPSHLMLVAALLGGSIALSRGEALKIEVLNGLFAAATRDRITRYVAAIGLVFYLGFLALIGRHLTVDYNPLVAFIYLPLFLIIGLKLLWIALGKKA
jgi:TRAP-type C4-dicarboxylate transport system permease small subunit